MASKTQRISPERKIALCYVRQSVTKDEKDNTSPERQRAHIQAVCDLNGWTPEWYEDVQGHRSGTSEKNRPGWLKLKTRLGDSDIMALIGNDLARFHRRGWRIGNLIELVDEHQVRLVLADPARHIDFSTPFGRTIAQFIAMMDEWYAMEISVRTKSSIAFRKSRGQSVGMPPFGTIRINGYLQRTPFGAWLLRNGRFAPGENAENPPEDDAIWRGYYECAELVLRMYAENRMGVEGIASKMHTDGWAFRDRQGMPAPFERGDVRRIVANWAEYGGHVSKEKARDRHPLDFSPENVTLNPEKAVFDIELLLQVGNVRRERSRRVLNRGIAQTDYPYPLGGLTYCAHCEQLAMEQNDPKLRSKLGGKSQSRYRHKQGFYTAKRKSTTREILETAFFELIKSLEIKPQYLGMMEELAAYTNNLIGVKSDKDLETEKAEAIAKNRVKIQTAKQMALDGLISYDECLKHIDAAERDIAIWQSRTTERAKIAMELTMCANAIERIAMLWGNSDDEERQGMAQHLFDNIVFDLDKEEIVGYELKSWASDFLRLRVAIKPLEEENEKNPQEEGTNTPHRRLELLFPP